MMTPVLEKIDGGDHAGERDEPERGQFHFRLVQMISPDVTPHEEERHEPGEQRLPDKLAQKSRLPQSRNTAETPTHHCCSINMSG